MEYNHSLKIKNHIHKRSSSNDNIDEILKGNTFLNAKYQQIFLLQFLNSKKKFVNLKSNFQCQTVGGYHQEQTVE